MKNLPVAVKIALVPALGVVCLFALHAFGGNPPANACDAPFSLDFKKPSKIAAGKDKFEEALKTHTKDKKCYHTTYDGSPINPTTYKEMKTAKVTKGDNSPTPAATAAAGGVNITQNAGFNTLEDLQKFVAALSTP